MNEHDVYREHRDNCQKCGDVDRYNLMPGSRFVRCAEGAALARASVAAGKGEFRGRE